MPRTLIDKLWEEHLVADLGDGINLLHIDRVFLHERSGAVALRNLKSSGIPVRRPQLAFATIDHIVDTDPGRGEGTKFKGGEEFIRAMRDGAHEEAITFFDINDPRQGITHVIAAEQGIAQPGATMVCGDSHTCTLGGLGALAWGVGSSGIEQALATQTVEERRPKTMRIRCDGRLATGVFAKDLVLSLIGKYGSSGGAGHAIEFAGSAIDALPIEARMTLCNMAIEFAAFTGIVAPDAQTIEYLRGRSYAPKGKSWDRAVAYWLLLRSDDDAVFDRDLQIDVSSLAPQVTWGTSPQHVVAIDDVVPDPQSAGDAGKARGMEGALQYMDLRPGDRMNSIPIEAAFIGSCTNARLSDLREAA
ncbi:MAG: 3-isopropylmalate dehydratase, partial [Aeromicrobium sp.]|nr:3-isopropylmalate dehydratase [Burkholderiales bacterium]